MALEDHQMSGSAARGISFFAGLLLILAGVFQALEALSAIVHDQYLVVAPRYIYTFDLTAWGWIHLLIGLGSVAIGICLLLGQGWALMAGIVIAAISAVVNLHLAALLAVLGDPTDRCRPPDHLGPRVGALPNEGELATRWRCSPNQSPFQLPAGTDLVTGK
jgi:hypothetical protein